MNKAKEFRIRVKKKKCNDALLYGIVSILLIFSCSYYFLNGTSATPSIFSRQEIADAAQDVYDIDLNNNHINATYSNDENIPDIRYINYFSNGKTLNATLWLKDFFKTVPSLDEDFHYGILIDADANMATGIEGADYQIDIVYNITTTKWEMFLRDFSTLSSSRTLENNLYENFFEVENNYVLLYFNLSHISNPEKYKAIFYSYVYKNSIGHYFADFTNWIEIPSPNYYISTIEPLKLRSGTQDIIAAKVKSMGGTEPSLMNINVTEIPLPLQLDVLYNTQNLSVKDPLKFKITVSKNTTPGEYSIYFLSKIATGSTFLPRFLSIDKYSLSVPTEGYMLVPLNLTVQVLEELTFQESFKGFWETFGGFISLLGGGFAAGFSVLVIDRLKNRKKNNKTLNFDY